MEEEEEAGLPAATGPKCLSALAAGSLIPARTPRSLPLSGDQLWH